MNGLIIPPNAQSMTWFGEIDRSTHEKSRWVRVWQKFLAVLLPNVIRRKTSDWMCSGRPLPWVCRLVRTCAAAHVMLHVPGHMMPSS